MADRGPGPPAGPINVVVLLGDGRGPSVAIVGRFGIPRIVLILPEGGVLMGTRAGRNQRLPRTDRRSLEAEVRGSRLPVPSSRRPIPCKPTFSTIAGDDP